MFPLACALLGSATYADEPGSAAGYLCNQTKDVLIVYYRTVPEENDNTLLKNEWDPENLVETANDGLDTVKKVSEGKGQCHLSDGDYKIFIYPNQKVGYTLARGMCADFFAPGARVVKDKKILFNSVFEECNFFENPKKHTLISSVVFIPHHAPVVVRVPSP
jgi:hypothetical protein